MWTVRNAQLLCEAMTHDPGRGCGRHLLIILNTVHCPLETQQSNTALGSTFRAAFPFREQKTWGGEESQDPVDARVRKEPQEGEELVSFTLSK